MPKPLLPLLLSLVLSLPVFSQKPAGERPQKDGKKYAGFLDIKDNDVSPDSEKIYSATDTEAQFLNDDELEKFFQCIFGDGQPAQDLRQGVCIVLLRGGERRQHLERRGVALRRRASQRSGVQSVYD